MRQKQRKLQALRGTATTNSSILVKGPSTPDDTSQHAFPRRSRYGRWAQSVDFDIQRYRILQSEWGATRSAATMPDVSFEVQAIERKVRRLEQLPYLGSHTLSPKARQGLAQLVKKQHESPEPVTLKRRPFTLEEPVKVVTFQDEKSTIIVKGTVGTTPVAAEEELIQTWALYVHLLLLILGMTLYSASNPYEEVVVQGYQSVRTGIQILAGVVHDVHQSKTIQELLVHSLLHEHFSWTTDDIFVPHHHHQVGIETSVPQWDDSTPLLQKSSRFDKEVNNAVGETPLELPLHEPSIIHDQSSQHWTIAINHEPRPWVLESHLDAEPEETRRVVPLVELSMATSSEESEMNPNRRLVRTTHGHNFWLKVLRNHNTVSQLRSLIEGANWITLCRVVIRSNK
jgi:hypothetical protein